ncbi:MAG: hypothetical protein KAT68_15790 [Bacteroidales bacterium]|nr:hypothetical protein [Bacteroidales bacterium]
MFLDNINRKHINSEKYFKKTIHYIHYNPVNHGFVNNINEWEYSSYNSILSDKSTLIKREEVIEWFDDINNFVFVHKSEP